MCRWTTLEVCWISGEWIECWLRVQTDEIILKECKMIGLIKGVYEGDCMGSCLVGRPQKRNLVNEFLKKKKGLNVGRARRMVYNGNEWQAFVKGKEWK